MSVSTSDFPIDPFDSYSYPLESEEIKKDTHAFIRYGGNGEVYPPPTPTRPLGITRPLPDITPTRLRPMHPIITTKTTFLDTFRICSILTGFGNVGNVFFLA